MDVQAFLARWHAAVAARDKTAIVDALADDVSLGAPPYWTRLEGKPVVGHLLGVIVDTIQGFTYHREWVSGRELALEFTGEVDGRQLQGIDLVTLADDGRIARLDVMIRPLNSLTVLRDRVATRMAEYLAAREG
jgi:SnoaL-like domain